jgi:flagellar protein FliS
MNNHIASLQYRRAATQQASPVGLVIALYDTLVGDLRRAADAIDRNDIQARCDQLIHGFKVLQQLDSMLDMENGGETALKVRRFYAHVRGQLLLAQFKLSSEILRKQIAIILDVRGAWQQLDSTVPAERRVTPSAYRADAATIESALPAGPRLSFSCSL